MTIHLPPSLETPILAAVHRGRYASLDDAMAEAAAMLVERLEHEQAEAKPPATNQAEAIPAYKPIWEVAAEIRRSIPAEEWAKLPKDGAEQLDHYLYGAPKRPTP
jgi:Arc/MetJ-type ribon-helix-helix transcriptional regulator